MRTKYSADYVLGYDGSGHTLIPRGMVVVEDDIIIHVGAEYDGDVDECIELGQCLLTPGLIDLDALTDIDHLILDSWASPDLAPAHIWSQEYFDTGRHDVCTPEERQTLREFALVQLALHGVTTYMPIASEIHSSWAETHDELVGMSETSRRLGLRGYLGPAYRSGVHVVTAEGERRVAFAEDKGHEGLDDARRFLDYARDLADPLVTGVLLPCRIETMTEDLLTRTAALATERNVPVRLHSLQGELEVKLLAEAGDTPIEVLRRTGLLDCDLLVPHGVMIDATDPAQHEPEGALTLLAKHGVSIIHCPLTSFRYGKALNSFDRFRAAGINIALGTDSFPPDLIRGMDAGMHLARLVEGRPDAGALNDYFDAATLGGAAALKRPDLGRLAPGAQADFVAFSLGDFRDGVIEDPLRTLVLNGTARQVTHSVVAGRPVVVDSAVPGIDLDALRARAQAIFTKMRNAYSERDARQRDADVLFPPPYPMAAGTPA